MGFGKIWKTGAFKKMFNEMKDEVKPRKLKQVPDSMRNSGPFRRKSGGGGFLKGVKKAAREHVKRKSSTGSKIKRSGKYVK